MAHGLIQPKHCCQKAAWEGLINYGLWVFEQKRLSNHAGGVMKAATVIGIALIILGIVALAYRGITYTQREKIVDIGPLQATADREKTIPLPPILGGLSLVGGIVLVIVGSKSRS